MLGEKISEATGKVSSIRWLPGGDYRYVKMEVNLSESGKLLGMDAVNMGTYAVFERVPGQLYGEGQGMLATSDGHTAIWNAHGVGKMTGQGMGASYRFSCAVQAPTTGPLARLNGVLLIGEHEADNDGNTKTTLWEWK